MNIEKVYIGSELKFKIVISASGFDMDTDDFEVELVCGKASQVLKKDDLIKTEDVFYIPIDTSLFPKGGDLYVVTKAYIPDPDFEDGYRTEIDKQLVLKVNKL